MNKNKKMIFTIFITGLIILLGAIIINYIANTLNIITWYEYINIIINNGFIESFKIIKYSIIFLYIVYPLYLGLLAYFSIKIFS